jgi:hypothetical protein
VRPEQQQFDERIGMPFAWYFYGLHGNLVKSGQMERVLEAAEAGLIVLPEHDYRVLRRWGPVRPLQLLLVTLGRHDGRPIDHGERLRCRAQRFDGG